MTGARVLFSIMLLWLLTDTIINSRWFANLCMKLRKQFYKNKKK